ncbi:hypothetical protein [Chitinophaga parva]|uniref:hypothetical protein n=1 Tax=Chitinophaga parva TaxID=2169414 RepID=UPI001402B425|nr:hypothetical protein [Chitinophaga parva]
MAHSNADSTFFFINGGQLWAAVLPSGPFGIIIGEWARNRNTLFLTANDSEKE